MDNQTVIAMIPARMGSQRLKKKNLRELHGVPLITHAIRKCKEAGVFNEVWINSEHPTFGEIAKQEGANFHKRPEALASNNATSEQFIYEFLKNHACDHIVQVHSIAPLLTVDEVRSFTIFFSSCEYDVLLSAVNEQIECSYENEPVNFNYNAKINSQELNPIQRVTWSITGWKRETYMSAYNDGKCATYSGRVGYFPINRLAGIIIKTEEDLNMAEALYGLIVKEK